MTEQKEKEGHKNYKGFVAGVFSGAPKLTGMYIHVLSPWVSCTAALSRELWSIRRVMIEGTMRCAQHCR
jgi:hypothetical protein